LRPPGDGRGPVRSSPPAGWLRVDIPAPDLPPDSELSIDAWTAWEEPGRAAHLVSGCLGVDLRTWADEAAPLALERVVATTSSVATRLASVGTLRVRGEEHRGNVVVQELTGAGDSVGKLSARAFLGFVGPPDRPHLEGCFLLCAPTSPSCESSLASAAPGEEFVSPPVTSTPLRAIVSAVHHPRAVVLGSLMLAVALGIVAIWTRPRPRTK